MNKKHLMVVHGQQNLQHVLSPLILVIFMEQIQKIVKKLQTRLLTILALLIFAFFVQECMTQAQKKNLI